MPSPTETIQSEITRIQTARNTIRTKLTDLGLATSTSKMDALATAVSGIKNNGAVNAQVQEGDSYTIPAGYHNGSGTVSGVAGGGNYSLQTKSVTPTKEQQSVAPDSGYYGLSAVTVGAIPDNYQDVSGVTAGAADVLATKIIVSAAGETIAGSMPNNGAVSKTLDTTTTSYTVPKGYHSGTGVVKITTETKTATPTKGTQAIKPTTGSVLSSVTVNPIPDEYITTTDATAAAADILSGKTAYVAGSKVEGTMAANGALSLTIDGLTETEVTIPTGYTTGGSVSLTSDILNALIAI